MYHRALSSSEVQTLYAEGNLDSTPPFSAITSPAAGATLSGVVTLRASALDDQELAGVQFWVDGIRVSGEVTSTPYQVTFHTGAYSNGRHVLTVVARDTSGNTTRSAAVDTTFSNGTAWLGKTMAIGDSLTAGYVSASDPKNRDGGYRRYLWERLVVDPTLAVDFVGSSTSGASTMDRDHEGHGDWRMERLTSMIPTWFASNPPDNVLLLTGTMDLLVNTDPAKAVRSLGALLDQIHTTRPSTRILVASIPGTTPGAYVPGYGQDISVTLSAQRIEAYNGGIPGLVNARASKGWNITFVDLYNLAGLSYVAGSPDFGPDGMHPSPRGYEKIASVWHAYFLTNLPPISLEAWR